MASSNVASGVEDQGVKKNGEEMNISTESFIQKLEPGELKILEILNTFKQEMLELQKESDKKFNRLTTDLQVMQNGFQTFQRVYMEDSAESLKLYRSLEARDRVIDSQLALIKSQREIIANFQIERSMEETENLNQSGSDLDLGIGKRRLMDPLIFDRGTEAEPQINLPPLSVDTDIQDKERRNSISRLETDKSPISTAPDATSCVKQSDGGIAFSAEVGSRNPLKISISSIPACFVFSGKENVIDFFRQAELIGSVNELDENRLGQIIILSLTGNARFWYESVGETFLKDISCFQEIKKCFIDYFSDPVDIDAIRIQFFNRRFTFGKVDDFIVRSISMYKAFSTNPTDSEMIRMISKQLPREMAYHISIIRKPENIMQFMQAATEYQTLFPIVTRRQDFQRAPAYTQNQWNRGSRPIIREGRDNQDLQRVNMEVVPLN